MKIVVIGSGYVGLVSGTCLAETGNSVVCVDIDERKIDMLNRGQIPIFEPGLEMLFKRNLKEGRLSFTNNLEEAMIGALVVFLALPTPPGKGGMADLKYVLSVAEHLGKIMTDYKVIVDKSTVPVGTADKVEKAIRTNYNGEFDVVSNPEFLREGVAVEDFMKPDRVVIGAKSKRAFEIMDELYAPYVRQGNPVMHMDTRSAELTKYAANSFLATKISFMNEIANLCELLGADVDMVRMGIGSDNRIGKRFLFPGIGYGGSCFPKDIQALIHSASEVNYDFKILKAVEEVNSNQKKVLLPKIDTHYPIIKGKTVAFWGLAFKPNTDDIREAPALEIIEALLERGARIQCFDPEAMPNVQKLLGDAVFFAETMYDALVGVDFLVITTEWPEFRTPDFQKLSYMIRDKVIFDGRNIYSINDMKKYEFTYYSIGRVSLK